MSSELRGRVTLVSSEDTLKLASSLSSIVKSPASGFILMGGDCAESFADIERNLESRLATGYPQCTLRLLSEMSAILESSGRPIVTIGRIAGQFAKPRSQLVETQSVESESVSLSLPAFRGDIINALPFTASSRNPDPQRMLTAYRMSEHVLNCIAESRRQQTESPPVFTAHECLLLPYEESLTRPTVDAQGNATTGWFAGSAHMLWVGERTRAAGNAHARFLSGVSNPVAVKLSASASEEHLLAFLHAVNPLNLPGRVSVIVRMGASQVAERLSLLVRAVQSRGLHVLWVTDPMHANTFTCEVSSKKTRLLSAIKDEIRAFFEVHAHEGSHAGGIHLELTGADVAECVGGSISPSDLLHRYHSLCDPRLNHEQALEVATFTRDLLKQQP